MNLDQPTPGNPLPDAVRGLVEIHPGTARPLPRARVTALPRHYTPKVAGYARGPFLDPQLVTPSAWRWRNCRSYVIRHSDGLDYRAVRVLDTSRSPEFIGYWAVELLGIPLTDLEAK